jgi:hypothetical protein
MKRVVLAAFMAAAMLVPAQAGEYGLMGKPAVSKQQGQMHRRPVRRVRVYYYQPNANAIIGAAIAGAILRRVWH